MLNWNELPLSEEMFLGIEFPEKLTRHLWAEEVVPANVLMEGRNLLNELLRRYNYVLIFVFCSRCASVLILRHW